MADSFPLIGSKQYYRAGAYENPVTAIDRQSGKIFTDAISKFSNTAVKAIEDKKAEMTENQKKAQEALDWTFKYSLEQRGKVLDDLKKSGNNNPQLIDTAFQEVDKMADVMGKAKSASTVEEQRALLTEGAVYQKRLGALQGHIAEMNDRLALWDEDMAGAPNTQGNLNLNNPEALLWNKKMAITRGQNPGKMSWFIDKDGDWAVRHEGSQLEKPTETKASLFFGFEPGIIPESDKENVTTLSETFGEKYQTAMPDDFLMGQVEMGPDGKEVMVPAVEYIKTNKPGMIQGIYRTNMEKVAELTHAKARAYAIGYAQDLNTAEAYWDGLGKKRKKEVIDYFAKQNPPINIPYDDLVAGTGMLGSDSVKVSVDSAQAIVYARQLQIMDAVPKFRLAGKPIRDPNYKDPGDDNNDGGGNNYISVQDLNTLVDGSIDSQINFIKGSLNKMEMGINYDKKANTIEIIDSDNNTTEKYYLDNVDGKNKLGIQGAIGDGIGGLVEWEGRLAELALGGGSSDRRNKILFDWKNQRNLLNQYLPKK